LPFHPPQVLHELSAVETLFSIVMSQYYRIMLMCLSFYFLKWIEFNFGCKYTYCVTCLFWVQKCIRKKIKGSHSVLHARRPTLISSPLWVPYVSYCSFMHLYLMWSLHKERVCPDVGLHVSSLELLETDFDEVLMLEVYIKGCMNLFLVCISPL
jgi:hypothetical protein